MSDESRERTDAGAAVSSAPADRSREGGNASTAQASRPDAAPRSPDDGAREGPRTSAVVVPARVPLRKQPRRARLTVSRIDPWTTLKFSFVYSLASFLVLVVAVTVLYGVIDGMGVIDSLRTFLRDIDPHLASYLSYGRLLLLSFVIGLVDVVLITALATLTAFVYNLCADLVGGIEVTLAERG